MRKSLRQPLTRFLLLTLLLGLVQLGEAQLNELTSSSTNSDYVNINGKYYRKCLNGYIDDNQNCIELGKPMCPGNQVLVNGLCYDPNQLPTLICPEGYFLSNNLCYPLHPKECPFNTTTTTEAPTTTTTTTEASTTDITTEPASTTEEPTEEAQTEEEPNETTTEYEVTDEPTEETTTTTTTTSTTTVATTTTTEESATTTPEPEPEPQPPLEPLPPLTLTRCPPDAVVVNNQCRKIICAKGEFYQGLCLLPACPEGTVWYREQCQPPGYITTIIEIENRIHNEQRLHKPHFETINVNRVEFQQPTFNENATWTATVTVRPATSSTTTTPASSIWPSLPTEKQPVWHESEPGNTTLSGCCTIVTPRLCKQYGPKWVCFHRRYKRCNPEICTSDLIYLKAPGIIYDSSVLVMPPNPPLRACQVAYCDEGDTVDCSGCADSERATCSPYCYRYMCPNGSCSYMDLRQYCGIYPGEFGCSRTDGCTWHWCE